MFKKNILSLSIGCGLCFMQMMDVMAFDPESTEFSQRKTLSTWVNSNIYRNELFIDHVQKFVGNTVPENPLSTKLAVSITNDDGITQYFGKMFPTIVAIELPFLQYVHEVSKHKKPTTLEVAAGAGYVSWKVPYAFENGGTHYANELSSKMLGRFDQIIDLGVLGSDIQGKPLKSYIQKIQGSCFDILNSHPELKEKIDVIYGQNVEHFFNPEQHSAYLELIADLLAPGGQAFLCAHSFQFGTDGDHPLRNLFLQSKKDNKMYPGFAQFRVSFKQLVGSQAQIADNTNEFTDVFRPEDNAIVDIKTIKSEEKDGIMFVTQEAIANYFSPEIYRKVLKSHSRLEVVDAFYIDKNGVRKDKWGANISHAAVIVKKKSKSEL